VQVTTTDETILRQTLRP